MQKSTHPPPPSLSPFMKCLFLISSLVVAFLMGSPTTIFVLASAPAMSTILVDQSGRGHFSTIQDAVNAVPQNNSQWTRIHVAAGVYKEKVTIPYGRGFIVLEGEGKGRTSIEWAAHASMTTSDPDSATFTLLAENFVAKRIAFKNTYSEEGYPSAPALAAIIWGDKAAFYDCSFIGYQDTLCDMSGRHYFSNCYIEGSVDFIFGLGQSIYEGCTLVATGDPSYPGWLTAQGRNTSNDTGGFIFKYCTVTGPGKTYLGRAWGAFSRVVFYKTYMSDIIFPEGWQAWYNTGHQSHFIYAESECTGPGSNTTNRVSWEKKLSPYHLEKYVDVKFINHEGWLEQQP